MDDDEDLAEKLTALQIEHRHLDQMIGDMTLSGPFDELLVKRLKLRKLALKDQITCLEDRLLPDIIA